jgi:hypothetical protein
MSDDKKNINLKRYETDVSGLSMKTLEAGLWWSKNRRGLKILLTVILALIGVPLIVYAIYGFGDYLLYGMNADSQMMKNFNRSVLVGQSYFTARAIKTPVISSPAYISDNGKYDLYAQVSNQNARWWASFNYCFTRTDGEKFCGSDFLLPNQTKYIMSLAQSFANNPDDLRFSLSGLHWTKIDNHNMPDWNKYQADHLNVSFSNQQFIPAAANAVSEKTELNSLSFTVANNSAYSFYEMPLSVVLAGNFGFVYINRYLLTNFISNQSQNIMITWPGDIENVTGISITPDINILDQTVYQSPQ